jgi:hypothetical protein
MVKANWDYNRFRLRSCERSYAAAPALTIRRFN